MKIGYACIPLAVQAKTNRRVLLKNYSEQIMLEAVKENLNDLLVILKYNNKNNIKMFRISSDIIPFGSHEINHTNWKRYFSEELKNIGQYITTNNMRVSMHPGQYTVLNSDNDDVVSRAVKDLIYHADFLDSMEIDLSHKIILHIGGIYGDKNKAIDRFIYNYMKLPIEVRNRLVIENDEKNYSIKDVLDISKEIKVPVIFDNLHNQCHIEYNKDIDDIFRQVKRTWTLKDGSMKVHYSQQDICKKMGAHSKTININMFKSYIEKAEKYNPDIMIEVKDKNISAIKCKYVIEELSGNHKKSVLYNEWAKYKYVCMERNYKYYKQCSKMVKEGCTILDFYNYIDEILAINIDKGNFVNTAEHVWGYVKKQATKREESHFRKLIDELNYRKTKNYLQKLCLKYKAEYMSQSYYFYY